jgi:hypothetical protein
MQVYLSRNGKQSGPYTVDQVNDFFAKRQVTRDDWAWTPGDTDWVPVPVFLAAISRRKASPSEPSSSGVDGAHAPDANTPGVLSANDVHRVTDTKPAERQGTFSTGRGVSGGADQGVIAAPAQRRSPGRAVVVTGSILVMASILVWAVKPEHVSLKLDGSSLLRPDAGYRFVDENDMLNWRVGWSPGMLSPTKAHWVASASPGNWQPAPGYQYEEHGEASSRIVWEPGRREKEFPHVAAGQAPGTWVTDAGYLLSQEATPTTPRAIWHQGVQLPHMKSAERENYWSLDSGYRIADLTVEPPVAVWSPGQPHDLYPHVYANNEEGQWHPGAGYAWVNSVAGDWRTFGIARTLETWRSANSIDAATQGIDCSSDFAFVAVIGDTRDRYVALDTTDVHPSLVEHIADVRDAYRDGTATINACLVASHAKEAVDGVAAVACGVSTMFSNQTYDDCMARSAGIRGGVGTAGTVLSLTCQPEGEAFRKRLDQLTARRISLQNEFLSAHRIQLEPPVRMVTCR